MTEPTFDQFWQLVWGATVFDADAFQQIKTLPSGNQIALYVVLLAGVSQAVGQSIILFVNQVKPIRFVLSLAIAGLLFVVGFMFWALSTWMIKNFLYPPAISFRSTYTLLGLSYAPGIFGFLEALPYFGVPIGVILPIWSFLSLLYGLSVATNITIEQAFVCGILGWLVLDILHRTIGRPVSLLGHWLTNQVAGVNLVTDLKDVEKLLQSGLQPPQKR